LKRAKAGWAVKGVPYIVSNNKISIYFNDKTLEFEFDAPILCVTFSEDQFWVGLLSGGVHQLTFTSNEITPIRNDFSNFSVTNIFKDTKNTMWLSTINNGIIRLNNEKTSMLAHNDREVLSVGKRKEKIYFTVTNGRLFSFNLSSNTFDWDSFKSMKLFHYQLQSFQETDDLFFTSSRFNKRPRHYKLKDDFCTETGFRSVLVCKRNDDGEYIRVYEDIYIGSQKVFDGIDRVYSMEIIDREHLWTVTSGQLNIVDLISKTSSLPKDEKLRQRINYVLKINDITYFGTNGNGLLVKQGNNIRTFGKKEGLIQTHINKIIEGDNGIVWLMGTYGITAFLPLNNGSFDYQYYSSKSLLCNKLNDLVAGDNCIYIATDKGIRRIMCNTELRAVSIPRLHFLGLQVNGVSTKMNDLTLDFNRNNFILNIDAVSFEGEPVSFRYRLNKSDDWIKFSEHVLRLNSILSGEYKLEVQASIDGVKWSRSELLEFEILPPFWKLWWFVLIEFGLGLGLITFLVLIRLKYVNRKHEESQQNMQFRQEALSQQMNPHFIFNALGSVQNSILKGDSIKANSYLVKFSRLLRSGLNASRSQLIPLEEDQELMQNYFSVEKTRLGDAFTFEVDVELESDPYSLQITPFLLQPFIENAIKHGMTDDMESGYVQVKYKEMDNAIQCSIEDDGVGRWATLAQSNSNHESHGLNIAFERIDLFNKSNGFEGEHRTIDLLDDNQNPVGTRVEFTVPVLKSNKY
jgi:hypothetical protein